MAAFDCYLKIIGPDIEGECKDADHEKWIELLSYKHGVSQPASGSRSSVGQSLQAASTATISPSSTRSTKHRPSWLWLVVTARTSTKFRFIYVVQ